MKVASLALTMAFLSSTSAYAEFTVPECSELRKFPIGVLENRIRQNGGDQTLYQFFGLQLHELGETEADRIVDAMLACNIPGNSDAPRLRSIMANILELAHEALADIELEIEGDQAEALASQERERDPYQPYPSTTPAQRPSAPSTGPTPLDDEKDLQAAQLIQTFIGAYLIGQICAESETSFTVQDVAFMEGAIRGIVDESNVSDARLDEAWRLTAGYIESVAPQLTTQDCIQTRQQANYLFKFPPATTTTPNPFAR